VPRVLHIEDDPANRLLVRKILIGAGFEVLEAQDGLEGVRMARAEPPDLVLVDLNIPGLNGYEVTLRLRGETALRDVPIVAITAEGDRSTSLAVGCDGFVQKPINARTFANTLRGFLRGRREQMPADEADDRLRAQSQQIVARLEAKVAELSDANARLLDATRARSAFYRNISHELATPMTPIVGYVKLLGDEELGPLNDAQRKALRSVRDCVERLRALIDNLLDVTGLETGRMRFIQAEFDLPNVVRRVLRQLEGRLAERSIQLATELPERRMLAMGDADRLARGLAQVVDNAIKFTPSGGSVGVRLRRSGLHYEMCVADSGPGIPKELLDRVLEPFYQVDGSPTRQFGGVGVGLAIARRVARGHGGDLNLRSPANETIAGVTFGGTACYIVIAERAPIATDPL
jgi:signal transduction histidine kinase